LRRRPARTNPSSPVPRSVKDAGSGTVGDTVTVVTAEYEFVTCPVARFARTVWNGTLNCDVKFAVQFAAPSWLIPLTTKFAVD